MHVAVARDHDARAHVADDSGREDRNVNDRDGDHFVQLGSLRAEQRI